MSEVAIPNPSLSPADAERFYAKHYDAGDCIEWTGAKDQDGYGLFKVSGKMRRATRIAYELASGCPVPKGIVVCHTCDNPSCVNPHHLFLGTPKENSIDMVTKGRSFHPIGDLHPMAKLTWEDVNQIRKQSSDGMSRRELAEKFGVCRSSIGLILQGKTWRVQA